MVVWTEHARMQLRDIHNYIAKDSPLYAKRTVLDITQKTKILEKFLKIGKITPETDQEHIRELSIHSYRIIYQIEKNDIYILAIVHKRQILEQTQFQLD
ncbi:type II toxin-antitoxin system RelE/ParE family toxin [Acinetobacter populi]|uniref:Plasmid stabilization protein n=1 Tax=Acinetobacter populi TaxID=1582270 RepID=A0A1Z9Z1M5_9GAMM|nr:type II toxin-antitoxin system RelE/ParE family toxin [Acinetobacter populi]OUY08388.1 hypothetical protein CAP51_01845 [Acinetobacter populi]